MHHYLRQLLAPASVALVGASDRSGSLARIVLENILEGEYAGELFLVSPEQRRILGRRTYPSLAAIGKLVDLAVVATPAAGVAKFLSEAPQVRLANAVLLAASPEGAVRSARRWSIDTKLRAAKAGVRLVGPGAFGVIRTDLGLNATNSDVKVRAGRIALVAQSGAVCTAILDFAAPMGIGFSTVLSLGGGLDIGFDELLDALAQDQATDAILLYVEHIADARRFLSALRAAARAKPVVVLKAGRSLEPTRGEGAAMPDAVFDAALRRSGTVRVHSYAQLFAAARILALGRIPRGDRLAIVTNGRGLALLAADSAVTQGISLARLAPATLAALDRLLPAERTQANPVDVRGDAPPARLAAAVALTLADPGVDAVLALHVPRPAGAPTDSARAVAKAAQGSNKPVLGAWLGSVERPDVRAALDAGGIANFYTPEHAVEAFALLVHYRRNQEWLLEAPPPYAEPPAPDLDYPSELRRQLLDEHRRVLTGSETHRLLRAFGMPLPALAVASSLAQARDCARSFGYPVSLLADAPDPNAPSCRDIFDARALARGWAELQDNAVATLGSQWSGKVLVFRVPRLANAYEAGLGLASDSTFGPVVRFGASRRLALTRHAPALMLPPLNRRLSTDLIVGSAPELAAPEYAAVLEPLARLMELVSTLACELPWVRELVLDPVLVAPGAVLIGSAKIVATPSRRPLARYRHMAIHPYPSELEASVTLRNGIALEVRPIRPEDGDLERRFVAALSDESRYFRFFYQLNELTPQMLARFTQVDYDRELALVAVIGDPDAPDGERFAGVARYVQTPERAVAEFALAVADDWQGLGVGRLLLQRLMACAGKRGIARLDGTVLRANQNMLKFSAALGFTSRDNPEDPSQVIVSREL